MPEPARDKLRPIHWLALGLCLALALLCGQVAQTELRRDARQKRRAQAAWQAAWGERYDAALPAWAYSEEQRRRWGLALAGDSAPLRPPGAQDWTPQRERRAFQAPPALRSLRVPELGLEDRCVSCHQFSQPGALPDPLLILAESVRAEDALALRAAGAKSGPPEGEPDASVVVDTKAHPGAWLLWHDPQRFGCTTCHGGVGSGRTLASSGHRAYLPPPMSGRANPLGATTELLRSAPELWASCGRCHPGDDVPANPLLSEGRQLARWLNCAGCHPTGPNLAVQPPAVDRAGQAKADRAGRPGPPLAGVAGRLNPAWLADYPNRAQEYAPGGRMPQYALNGGELAAIGAYLGGLKPPQPAAVAQAAGEPGRGAKLAEAGKCLGCHSGLTLPPGGPPANGQGVSLRPGPPLEDLQERLQAGALERILADPAGEFPGTRMPQFSFTAQQRADLAAWIGRQAGASRRPAPSADVSATADMPALDAARARQLLAEKGCSGCHSIPGVGLAQAPPGPSLRNSGAKALEALPLEALPGGVAYAPSLYDYFMRQLDTPEVFSSTPAAMPHFALSPRQRAALAVALLAERAPPPAQYILPPVETRAGQDYWPWPIPPQGAGPEWLSPLERSLDPRDCAQCHPKQFEEWSASRHARAMGPGVTGQIIEWARDKPAEFYDCLRCHARLSEQLPLWRSQPAPPQSGAKPAAGPPASAQPCAAGSRPDYSARFTPNPAFRPGLASQAHGCANCHVRAHTRQASDKPRLAYPWEAARLSAHPLKREPFLRSSVMCKDCHQFDPGQTILEGGPPLENTYAEWLAWSSQAREPQSCQGCHMPDGAHGFKGIHNAEFVRAAVTVTHKATLAGGQLRARLTLANTNNGHHLPTYVTPRIWMQGWLADAEGRLIQGSWQERMIGRDARNVTLNGKSGWRDFADTRIPAEGEASLDYALSLPAGAARLHLEIFCVPDSFYHNAYGRWLEDGARTAIGRALLEQARSETAPFESGYYIYRESFSLAELAPESPDEGPK